ncbi:chlororespiratory reduction 6 domain-containing protein [Clostridium sp. YIM B02505]|uniref:Chlororespiratory reduction 6 domain-containing protein n=1 Tax=Clostridium yunnanense TaxID=2800325 RepID=A0ABS1ESV9_9CLOT|nr:chlororespiratory reduction 6 domain-containing protein [Clostridium yunnanense]MBK1812456.1 chlororespiratory reduction 6 domain-containing protein [Clostridium yunnanense]
MGNYSDDGKLHIMILNKSYIEALDLQEIDRMLTVFKRDGVKKYKNNIVFQVDGYDDDPREIFEIPEIKAFYKKVFDKYPYMLYFLSNVNSNDAWVLACLCNKHQTCSVVGKTNIDLKMQFDNNLLSQILNQTIAYMRQIRENSRSILKMRVRLASMLL